MALATEMEVGVEIGFEVGWHGFVAASSGSGGRGGGATSRRLKGGVGA